MRGDFQQFLVGMGVGLLALGASAVQAQPAVGCEYKQLTDSVPGAPFFSVREAELGSRTVALYVQDDRFGSPALPNTYLFDSTDSSYSQYIGMADVEELAISADDTTVALITREQVVAGGNDDGSHEVYLYDVATDTVQQITSADSLFDQFGDLSVNADGSRIAFRATTELAENTLSGSSIPYVYDRGSDSFLQIDDPTDQTVGAALSGDGSHAALHLKVAGGEAELALVDLTDFSRVVVTPGVGVYEGFVMDHDGDTVAFTSYGDLTGQNADGSMELFLYQASTGVIQQLTSAPDGFSAYPSISADGETIAFVSNVDFGGLGTNLGTGAQRIWVLDVPSGELTALTSDEEDSYFPSISPDGRRIAFHSATDPSGDNPDFGWEAFLATCSGGGPSVEPNSRRISPTG